jgi:hypothetical protein
MRKINFITNLSALLLLLISITACNEDNCMREGRCMASFYFYSKTTKAAVTVDSLTVLALGTDSILINKDAKIKSFTLPLDMTKSTTTFILKYGEKTGKPIDTLIINQTNKAVYISKACGTAVYHYINDITCPTKSIIDSIAIKNVEVKENEADNVHLYLNTGSN